MAPLLVKHTYSMPAFALAKKRHAFQNAMSDHLAGSLT